MPIVKIPAIASNYATGRGAYTALAVYLHFVASTVDELDALACRKKPANLPNTSFHYGVDFDNEHQYVDLADTAFAFGSTSAVPAVPGKIGGTDDQNTVNVAVSIGQLLGTTDPACDFVTIFTDNFIKSLAQVLADIHFATGLTLNSTLVLFDTTKYPDFPITEVLAAANAIVANPPYVANANLTIAVVATVPTVKVRNTIYKTPTTLTLVDGSGAVVTWAYP